MDIAVEDAGLDGCADRDDFVGVDVGIDGDIEVLLNAFANEYAGIPEPSPAAFPIGVQSIPVRSMSASRQTSPSAFSQRVVEAPALTLRTNSINVPTSEIPLSSDGSSPPPPPPFTIGLCLTMMDVETS